MEDDSVEVFVGEFFTTRDARSPQEKVHKQPKST